MLNPDQRKTVWMVFQSWCSLQFADFSVFYRLVFSFDQKYLWIFWFGIPCGFQFFLFGFQFLFNLSGNYVPPLMLNSHETSTCSTCYHCIRSVRILITGIWKFIGFDSFACRVFSFDQFLWFCSFLKTPMPPSESEVSWCPGPCEVRIEHAIGIPQQMQSIHL